MPLGIQVGLSPGDFVLDEDPAPFPQRGGAPNFRPTSFVATTAAWIKMPRGTEVGLCLLDILLDGEPAPPPLKVHSTQFSSNVRCGQRLDGLRCHLVWR